MGFRTVVVLSNDQAHQWQKDAELGEKIWIAAADKNSRLEYGEIVEQVHADTQSLAILDGYGGSVVAQTWWNREQTPETLERDLLKSLAAKHGYRLSKLPKKT